MKQAMLTNEQVGSVCMALAHLLHAGIGTADALVLLQADEQDAALQAKLGQMARLADSGAPLSQCLQESGCFPAYVCTLVEVGQRVGRTEQTLQALAAYYRDRARLMQRLKTALQYPVVLLAVLLAVLAVLLIWVLPVFDDVYARLGAGLTGLAAGLLGFGQVLGKALPWLAVALALLAVLLSVGPVRRYIKAAFWKRFGDRGVLGQVNAARFMQALSLGRASGMTDREAVELARKLSGVPGFQKRCDICLQMLDGGASLQQSLRQSKLLSPAECRLLEAGLRSGQGERVLEDISQRLLERSEEELEQQAGRIEPALVAVSCLLIGLVIAAVMLPLMQIMAAIG